MRSFKHISFNDRLKIEVLRKAGHTPKEIAELLHFHISTIYRELKRGQFEALNSDLTTEIRYSPDIAQEYMNGVLSAKGADLKIGNEKEFADRIEEIIINEGYSPAAALAKAKERFGKRHEETPITTDIVFNIEYPTVEPILNVADYFCWAVQRVFEKGETRFYDFLKDKISLVIDLDDSEKYAGFRNYYSPKNPLTVANKKSPLVH